MTMEALASNEFPSYLVYDTITANPLHGGGGGGHHHNHGPAEFFFENAGACGSRSLIGLGRTQAASSSTGMSVGILTGQKGTGSRPASGLGAGQAGKRKRRRRPRSCKNKEEAETQRMTHIAVERNRRRQMNEHLAVLRSLMPESYIQRGDQASIVGGAIDFVKELEQLAQSLEAQKRTLQQQRKCKVNADTEQPRSSSYSNSVSSSSSSSSNSDDVAVDDADSPPFAQFFAYPQYIWRQAPGRECCPSPAESHPAAPADIEVTLTETHANLRILSPKRPRQLLKMVAALQTLRLTILHLNVTTLDSMVLYSFSLKVEEGCNLTSVDDIAAAVHHILSLIEAELTGGVMI